MLCIRNEATPTTLGELGSFFFLFGATGALDPFAQYGNDFFPHILKRDKNAGIIFPLLYGKKGELFRVGNCFLSLPLQSFRPKHGFCGSRWDADDEADVASILNAFFKPSTYFSFYRRRYLRWRIANSRQWLNFCRPLCQLNFFWGLKHRFD